MHHVSLSAPVVSLAFTWLEEPRRSQLLERIDQLADQHLNEFMLEYQRPLSPQLYFRSIGQNHHSLSSCSSSTHSQSAPTIVSCGYQPQIHELPTITIFDDSPQDALEFFQIQKDRLWRMLRPRLTKETWEGLVHLYHIIGKTRESVFAHALLFAAELILSMTPCEAENRIGKLIHAVDTVPTELLQKMNDPHFAEKLHWLDNRFKNIITDIREDTELVKTLANLLITSQGNINSSLREFLLIECVLSNPNPTSNQKALERGLRNLRCQDVRSALLKVTKPLYDDSTSAHLIRLYFNIPRDTPLTDYDAKKTALSAFLSPLRQGDVGSCFATSVAILLLNSSAEKCINDFSSLITFSKLHRTVNGICRDFPFLLRNSNGYGHPLLKAWENSLAEMSEGKDQSMIKPSIHYSILTALKQAFPCPDENSEVAINRIQETLTNRIHLHYDPSTNAQESRGGFLIYDTMQRSRTTYWKRIDTPTLFIEFLLSVIGDDTSDRIIQQLHNHVNDPSFINQITILYYPQNEDILSAGGSWKQMEYTPWKTICGNIAQTVLEVYHEMTEKYPSISLDPQKPTTLLESIITFLKKLPQERQALLFEDPFQRLPLYTPLHAFTLLAGNPKLVEAVKSPLSPSEWIDDHLIRPGYTLATTTLMPVDVAEKIATKVSVLLPKKVRTRFLESIQGIPSDVTIIAWHNALLSTVNRFDPKEDNQLEKRTLKIDTICYHEMPHELLQAVTKTLIPLADTNWSKGGRDLFIGISIDILSGVAKLMEMRDDNSAITPLQQPEMFMSHWEIIIGG